MNTSDIPLAERLKKFNKPLLADKVQMKYKAMAENTYRFYRGTCHIFYEDLNKGGNFPESPPVWACGDLHLENFGSYKANNRFVYFDQNDFGESLLAPAAIEVVRMACSIFIAFIALNIKDEQCRQWALLFVEKYAETLVKGKAKHIEFRLAEGIVKRFLEQVLKKKPKDLLKKHLNQTARPPCLLIDGEKHCEINDIRLKKELMYHVETWLHDTFKELIHFEVMDVAFRIAGTGSLGCKRYVFFLQNNKKKKKIILLDMKESRPSSVLPFTAVKQPSWNSDAEREIAIESRSQYATSDLLGTTRFRNDFYVLQEMQPTEDKIDFREIVKTRKDVSKVIEDMALLTASAHLRTSGRQGSAIADELISFGADKAWQAQVLEYADNYSEQVERDYEEFLEAFKKKVFDLE